MRLIDQLAELQGFDRALDDDRRRYAEIQEALHEPDAIASRSSGEGRGPEP